VTKSKPLVIEGFLRIGLLVSCFWGFSAASRAVDPIRPLEQLRLANWNQQNGLPQDSMNGVAQTSDGFLWVASDESLVRFDGVEFFVPGEFQQKPRLRRTAYCLWSDADGRLWMGSHSGVYCRTEKGKFEYFDRTTGIPSTQIFTIAVDREGTAWAGTYRAGLFWKNGDRFTEFAPARELRQQRINKIYPGKSGDVWVATSEALYKIDKSRESLQRFDLNNGLRCNGAGAITLDLSGRLWVGTADGLAFLDNDKFYPVSLPMSDNSEVTALFTDSHGMIWIGSRKGGIWRMPPDLGIRAAEFRSVSTLIDGRSSSLISGFSEDREGNIWISSDAGLFRLSDTRFTVCDSKQGLPSDLVNTVLSSRSGRLWIGTDSGLAFLGRTGQAARAPSISPILSEQINALYEDPHGVLWVGTAGGAVQSFQQTPFAVAGKLTRFNTAAQVNAICGVPPDDVWVGTNGGGLYRFHDGKLVQCLTEQDGIFDDVVHTLALGPDNTLWIAAGHSLLKYKDGKLEDAIPSGSPLHSQAFISLLIDPDGTIWAGTFGYGLARIKNGSFSDLCKTTNGLFSDEFFTLIKDDKGNIWASSNRGIFAISERELNDFFDGKPTRISCRRFTAADGLRTAECNGGNANTSCRTSDGRLWFATVDGVAATTRETLVADSKYPPVVMERMMANLTQYIPIRPGKRISLSPDINSIEIHYAGMNLSAPESLQYRYKLDGFDTGWVDAGTRRVAFYTNLPPGKYKFEVIAGNRDGVWTPENLATRTEIILEPHFYQTWWFDLLCFALVLLLIWALYSWRLQQILQERARLARDLHDTLARGLVGILWQTESGIKSGQRGQTAEAVQTLDRISDLARETLMEARGALKALRAGILAESSSLVHALEKVVKKGASATSLKTAVRVRGKPFRVRSEWEQAIVRITQEALTNTIKHARAKRFEVELHFEEKGLTVSCADDGAGFDRLLIETPQPISSTSSGLGILGMKERCKQLGGELTIGSCPRKGTSIQVSVPAGARCRRRLWQKPALILASYGRTGA
jgi:ligand-binding sensor domain-containing protein/signal transduction histidine kinase